MVTSLDQSTVFERESRLRAGVMKALKKTTPIE